MLWICRYCCSKCTRVFFSLRDIFCIFLFISSNLKAIKKDLMSVCCFPFPQLPGQDKATTDMLLSMSLINQTIMPTLQWFAVTSMESTGSSVENSTNRIWSLESFLFFLLFFPPSTRPSSIFFFCSVYSLSFENNLSNIITNKCLYLFPDCVFVLIFPPLIFFYQSRRERKSWFKWLHVWH